jgi:hypothetical protein
MEIRYKTNYEVGFNDGFTAGYEAGFEAALRMMRGFLPPAPITEAPRPDPTPSMDGGVLIEALYEATKVSPQRREEIEALEKFREARRRLAQQKQDGAKAEDPPCPAPTPNPFPPSPRPNPTPRPSPKHREGNEGGQKFVYRKPMSSAGAVRPAGEKNPAKNTMALFVVEPQLPKGTVTIISPDDPDSFEQVQNRRFQEKAEEVKQDRLDNEIVESNARIMEKVARKKAERQAEKANQQEAMAQ